ncbi:S8 family peptidase [Sphingobacterium detergens]|uniref:S8 family peptidase n=1 Tax=Sphingobacterium detergens TaxID=1145106 RepID=UPI003AAA86CF
MKRILLFVFLAALVSCQKTIFNENIDHRTQANEQLIKAGSYFWSNGQKVPLSPDSSLYLVQLTSNANISKVAKAGGKKVAFLSTSRVLIGKTDLDAENVMSKAEKSEIIGKIHSFKVEDVPFKPNGKIVFKPKSAAELPKIKQLIGDQIYISDTVDYDVYTAEVANIENILNTANKLYESGLVEFSHPDFIAELKKTSNDPLYTSQYYLNQSNNIDINAPEAWTLLGSTTSTVKVAVIDDGVEAHEELTGRLLTGYTPKSASGYGAPTAGSDHGQAVAGIVAAKRDNNIGIAGVADFARIIPVNIFYGGESYSDVANAINWAWSQGGADILQNSWSVSSTQTIDVVKNAINNAYTNGRNGKGCVIVFSSGNYHPEGSEEIKFNGVAFPANLPNVIAVGAVARDGIIARYSSRGPEIDLVAPSGQDGAPNVWTIDRMGTLGYSPDNYTSTFSGTSAAAPEVSGVAALLLAKFPNLTAAEVKNLLVQNATDMGSVGFDNIFGYGRVNASAALLSGPSVIEGPSQVCTEGIYTIFNPGTATLEDASGIATLTALGNNQWKVTRVGNRAGFIKLKITNANNYITEKTIDVGAAYDISGRPIVNPGQIYTYTVDASLGNVSFFVGGASVISTTANTVRVKILNAQNGALPYFYISATAQTACGTSKVTIYPTVQEYN